MSKHTRHIINANRKHKEGDGKHFMAYPLYQAQAFCNSARICFQDIYMREVYYPILPMGKLRLRERLKKCFCA